MEQNYTLTSGHLTVPCKLTLPFSGDIRRVVLGVHGITGSSEDEIQAGIAEEMALFGCAAVRFDFPAHGENPMGCEDFSLANCVGTLLTVAQDAKERFPEVEDLCIFASGFGAYVTLVALPDLLELPGRVRLVVQTPSVRMDDTLLSMLRTTKATLWAMDKGTFKTARPLEVTYSFYEELVAHPVMNSYPIPMLILHGETDTHIRSADIQLFHRINEDAKLVIIPGTSHRFLEEGAWDMVLDLTRDWFAFEQVLLADAL